MRGYYHRPLNSRIRQRCIVKGEHGDRYLKGRYTCTWYSSLLRLQTNCINSSFMLKTLFTTRYKVTTKKNYTIFSITVTLFTRIFALWIYSIFSSYYHKINWNIKITFFYKYNGWFPTQYAGFLPRYQTILYLEAAMDRVIFTSRTYSSGKFFHPRRPVSAVNSSITIGLRPSVPKNLRSHADRSMRL